YLRMARLSHADQSGLPVPRFDSRRAHRARPGALPRPCAAHAGAAPPGHSGMAELLLQVADDSAGTVSRARSVHPAHEVEEHAAAFEGRRTDHASGAGVLRLAALPRTGRRVESGLFPEVEKGISLLDRGAANVFLRKDGCYHVCLLVDCAIPVPAPQALRAVSPPVIHLPRTPSSTNASPRTGTTHHTVRSSGLRRMRSSRVTRVIPSARAVAPISRSAGSLG